MTEERGRSLFKNGRCKFEVAQPDSCLSDRNFSVVAMQSSATTCVGGEALRLPHGLRLHVLVGRSESLRMTKFTRFMLSEGGKIS